MKRMALALAAVLFLTGCGADDQRMEQALELRGRCLGASECGFRAKLTLDSFAIATYRPERTPPWWRLALLSCVSSLAYFRKDALPRTLCGKAAFDEPTPQIQKHSPCRLAYMADRGVRFELSCADQYKFSPRRACAPQLWDS